MVIVARKRKTTEYGRLIAAALDEAVAIKKGSARSAKTQRMVVTAGDAAVVPPPDYDAGRVRSIRDRLALSQAVFARLLNVSDSTVKAWEQGLRQPSGATCRLLELAEEHPDVLVSWLRGRELAKA